MLFYFLRFHCTQKSVQHLVDEQWIYWWRKLIADLGKLQLFMLWILYFSKRKCYKGNLPLKSILKSLNRENSSTIAWNTAAVVMIFGCHSPTNLPSSNKRNGHLKKKVVNKVLCKVEVLPLPPYIILWMSISWYQKNNFEEILSKLKLLKKKKDLFQKDLTMVLLRMTIYFPNLPGKIKWFFQINSVILISFRLYTFNPIKACKSYGHEFQ